MAGKRRRTEIHFIAIKICVVWVAYALVQPEGAPWTHFDLWAKSIQEQNRVFATYTVTHNRQLDLH